MTRRYVDHGFAAAAHKSVCRSRSRLAVIFSARALSKIPLLCNYTFINMSDPVAAAPPPDDVESRDDEDEEMVEEGAHLRNALCCTLDE